LVSKFVRVDEVDSKTSGRVFHRGTSFSKREGIAKKIRFNESVIASAKALSGNEKNATEFLCAKRSLAF
jgi:hypothetical protein